jgi:N-acetylneuraminic acid mutarotase
MIRTCAFTLVALTICNSAFGHFVFLVPAKDGKTLNVVMSETLEPDEAVALGPVAGLKLQARGLDITDTSLSLTAHAHHLTGPASRGQVVFGTLDYGVMTRDQQAIMLKYHPKVIIGTVAADRHKLGKVAAEIVPERVDGEGVRFRVLVNDVAAAKVSVTVLTPDGVSKQVMTDTDGRTPVFAAPGRYGVWARILENTAGEYQNQKYASIRHYPTLVFDYSFYPPLPEAVSSFGAAVADGWVYVFGGHRAEVHFYDTTAVTGGWRRLNLAQPKKWDDLPGGQAMQGLALVTHEGKLIRVGGMAPLNAPGTKTINRSTASCDMFDPAKNAWQPFPALPQPRSSHDIAIVGDTLIVVGGWNMLGPDGNDWCEDALTLDLRHPEAGWKSVPQPFRRRALQAAVLQNRVYIVGGLDDSGEVLKTVSVFDPATKNWSNGPELPGGNNAGFSPGICPLNGRLYVSVADGTVARLSADGGKWEPIAKVMPRVVHRMVPASENTLLLLGGASRGDNLDTVETVTLPKN